MVPYFLAMNIKEPYEIRRAVAMAGMPVGRLLGIAGRLTTIAFSRVLDDQGLSHTGWILLSKLEEEDNLTQGDVAARCFVTPATLTSVVDSLESAGSLTRKRDTLDRRVLRLRITAAGRDLLHQTRAVVDVQMAPIFAGLSKGDEAVVRRFLTTVIGRLTPSYASVERTP